MSRRAKAITGVGLLAVAGAVGAGLWWPSTAGASADIDTPIRAVAVHNGAGNVTIRTGDVAHTTVQQRLEYTWNRPTEAYTVDGDTLRLDGCGWSCTAHYDVLVGEDVDVDGTGGSGSMSLHGVGDVDLVLNSGDIAVHDGRGTVDAETTSGDIDVRLADAEPVTARSNDGDVRVRLPDAADVATETTSGDVTVTVPDEPFRVTTETESGNRSVAIPTDPGAEHAVEVTSTSGDVDVRGS